MDDNIPKHVAIILDGNRRFAKKLAQKPWKGHEAGAQTVQNLIEWSGDLGIKELTLYSFSTENFNRPKEEVDFLMNILKKKFKELSEDPRIHKNKIKIRAIGRLEMFSEDVREILNEIMEKTKNYDNFIINFALAYGGRPEITDAVKKIAKKVKSGELEPDNIDENTIANNLYLQSEPDIIIRTSEQRLSGFLTWQSIYAEIIFLPDLLWPEFTKEKLQECIDEYSRRKRRFGK
jgi:tritrans,polycis-undecaprenyl-diphosphate synthase [geranylgeranyl-diphosphate specific]